MFHYFLEVSIAWFVFYSIYFLFLRNETFFSSNRWYLIHTLWIGVLIPLIRKIPINSTSGTGVNLEAFDYINTTTLAISSAVETAPVDSEFDLFSILTTVYCIGLIVGFTRMFMGLKKIHNIWRAGTKIKYPDFTLVKSNKVQLPFSFVKFVFINEQFLQKTSFRDILNHEILHIKAKHTYDVLALHTLVNIFWWNPIIYFYKKSIKETHEYMADAYALSASDKKNYGQILLGQSSSGIELALTHQFFNSHLKKRINMMYKEQSALYKWGKYLLVLPMIICMALLFSSNKIVNETDPPQELIDQLSRITEPENFRNLLHSRDVIDKLSKDETVLQQHAKLIEAFPDYESLITSEIEKAGLNVGRIINITPNEHGKYCMGSSPMPKSLQSFDKQDSVIHYEKGTKITYGADEAQILKNDTGLIHLKGNAYVNYNDGTITADHIILDLNIHSIKANGNAVYSDQEAKENSIPTDNQPLIVIDGKIVPENSGVQLSVISPDNIAHIKVLKGPEAITQYGERGANGVLLITLKDGAKALGLESDDTILSGSIQKFPIQITASKLDSLTPPDAPDGPPFPPNPYDVLDEMDSSKVPLVFVNGEKIDLPYRNSYDPGVRHDWIIMDKERGLEEYGNAARNGVWIVNYAEDDLRKLKSIKLSSPSQDEKIFKVVEEMPRFPGCEDLKGTSKEIEECSKNELLDYLYTNLVYPEEARNTKVEGMVVVQFIIEKDGSLTNIKCVRNVGAGCDDEAKRVMHKMAKEKVWRAGHQRGKPVRVLYTLPVKFKLDSDNAVEENKAANSQLPRKSHIQHIHNSGFDRKIVYYNTRGIDKLDFEKKIKSSVAFELCINKTGIVTYAELIDDKTTLDLESEMQKSLLKAVYSYKFAPDENAPNDECKELIIYFGEPNKMKPSGKKAIKTGELETGDIKDGQPILKIMGNPARDRLAYTYVTQIPFETTAVVTQVNGTSVTTINSKDLGNKIGSNLYEIDLSAYTPGVYNLSLIQGAIVTTQSFVVQ